MINAKIMRKMMETARIAKEDTIRAEAARWLRIYESDMKAKCEEGAYLLPRHNENEVNERAYTMLNALGYECEYKDNGILIKW